MVDTLYKKLADRLDAIPGGFPRTESGAELRLLEKLFTERQAKVFINMRLLCDPAEVIAERIGWEKHETRKELKGMIRDGLIRAQRSDKGLVYGMLPFVVGIYEMNLHRLDEEMAQLFEDVVKEAGSDNPIFRNTVHRVIPVEEAVPHELGIHSHDSAIAMVEEAKSWGVRDCICRVQKDLIGEGCDHPKEVCLMFSSKENAYEHDPISRALTKEEAIDILNTAAEAGLVHTTGNYRDGHNYICNCCTCSCGVLRGIAEFDVPTAVAHSGYRAVVDAEACTGCGVCVKRCQFGAISIIDKVAVIDHTRCVGCGSCVLACKFDALTMETRPPLQRKRMPNNLTGWMVKKGLERPLKFVSVIKK